MKKINFYHLLVITILITATQFSCGQSSSGSEKRNVANVAAAESPSDSIVYKVTFIELGSVKCIPCQQMQVVMKSIESKYGKEVKIDFYDVWTEAGKPYGLKYGIDAIPTQVFLDNTGKEYYRHVGFFPEDELVKVLQQKGVGLN